MTSPAPPPTAEPMVTIPRELLEEAAETLAGWAGSHGIGSPTVKRLQAALAEPAPAPKLTLDQIAQVLGWSSGEIARFLDGTWGATAEDCDRNVEYHEERALALRALAYRLRKREPVKTEPTPAPTEEAELTTREICELLEQDRLLREREVPPTATLEEPERIARRAAEINRAGIPTTVPYPSTTTAELSTSPDVLDDMEREAPLPTSDDFAARSAEAWQAVDDSLKRQDELIHESRQLSLRAQYISRRLRHLAQRQGARIAKLICTECGNSPTHRPDCTACGGQGHKYRFMEDDPS